MSDLPIKATFKSGAGYDAPWITVDAADPDDLSVKLDAILDGESLSKVIEVANLFKAANIASPLAVGGPDAAPAAAPAAPAQQQGWGNRPPQQAAAPAGGNRLHPEGKTCGCGNVLNFKQVSRKSDGKQFSFWECPARTGRNDTAHVSEFAN